MDSLAKKSTDAFSSSSPMLKQYFELKNQAPEAFLLFRMGDFYELFGEDAVAASKILDITLTTRDKNKPHAIPMAGVPHHSAQNYIQKLLKSGKKVAIAEQIENTEALSKPSEKLMKREIVRTFTPGIQFNLEGSEVHYLSTLIGSKNASASNTGLPASNTAHAELWTLACLDASTGEVLLSQLLPLEKLLQKCEQLPIHHFLDFYPELNLSVKLKKKDPCFLKELLPKNYLSLDQAKELLKTHYQLSHLGSFFHSNASILALGILLTYVLRTQRQDQFSHLRLPEPLQKPKTLILGPQTFEHLELSGVFNIINQTKSTLGTRHLSRWLKAPLQDPSEIKKRQNAIFALKNLPFPSFLSQVYDLERISARINTKLAHPKDTLALGQSLSHLKNLQTYLEKAESPMLVSLRAQAEKLYEKLEPLTTQILLEQHENPPLTAREGGIFKYGTTPELDHILSLTQEGQKWLIDLEAKEREQSGIPTLKIKYNRVFGYFIEITQMHLKKVPPHYQRKQTTVGGERFFTEELKKFEEEILTASLKQKALEQKLFEDLIRKIESHIPWVMEAAEIFGKIDALTALAQLANQPGWCFPEINDSLDLSLLRARHPLVDQSQRGQFIPNNLELSPNTQMTLLITGPNMGGKSTLMRMAALIIILGQMGAPIPAQKGSWGYISSIYTRIGAQDMISQGQSTFMVEMSELAHLLHHSDERSFIILDEIGRGTSTYDGMSVAWSTLEWISAQIGARTLFATHYHELVQLAETLPLLANAHLAVEGTKSHQPESLRFLYELKKGPMLESFGIHVAQLAGLPQGLTKRAWEILSELESHSPKEIPLQGVLEITPPKTQELHPILQEIKGTLLDETTPLQAFHLLEKWKKNVEEKL